MPDTALPQTLAQTLQAYINAYGMPDSQTQLAGIVGTLVSLQQEVQGLVLQAHEAEVLVQQVLGEFRSGNVADWVIGQAQQTLAQQAHQWRETAERRLRGTINAYVQQFAPNLPVEEVKSVVMATLPMIQDRQLTKAEALALAENVAASFSVGSALQAAVGKTSLGIAKNLAIALTQKPLEDAVTETVAAYVRQFAPTVTSVGDSLIENAVEAILRNRVEFNIDTHLNLENRQLLVQQVAFKLNILQADPPSSRTAEEVATQVHGEIQRFREQRSLQKGTDATAGTLSSDGLSITTWTTDSSPDKS
jgi:hypothetical protein